MSELDKKLQKSQPDLVQLVLEAQEKKNIERVDVLITNALKQLKISRFKPDQATCLSLIYLARISPKSFSQSNTLKELLKAHLRRDNGPTNIKPTIKNDFILPVLAANILLACSDTPEIRSIILKKIEQWICTHQKINDNVQNLLAIFCVRCQGDTQTVKTLIDLRQHWFNCLDVSCGPIALDLCNGIRRLIQDENNCESLVENLAFLIKHDRDITGLARDVSKFMLNRPITTCSMLSHSESGSELRDTLVLLYVKLFEELQHVNKKLDHLESPVFFKHPTSHQAVATEQCIIEALLSLFVSSPIDFEKQKGSRKDLLNNWILGVSKEQGPSLYTDSDLNTAFLIGTKLRLMLVQSNCDPLISIGLQLASPSQLVDMLFQFGTTESTVIKIINQLNKLNPEDLHKVEIKEPLYFMDLLDHFTESRLKGATELRAKFEGSDVKETNVKAVTKVKVEC